MSQQGMPNSIELYEGAVGYMRDIIAGIRPDQEPDAVHAYKDLMMPALVRVGAVTDRTRALYEEARIPVYSDARVLDAMEAETATDDA